MHIIDILWNFASFIIALGILVTVHEFGHFWVARKCGVKVKCFSIGFGKVLWRKKGKHGTEFVISLLPLGGYVRMLDERVDDVATNELPLSFNRKNVYQRIAIIAAGPLANFIFAVFAFYLMFLIGVPSIKPVVGEVAPTSIAEKAEIAPQSQIMSVNGVGIENWQDVNLQLIAAIGSEAIALGAKQPNSQYVKTHQLNTTDWHFKPETQSALTTLGLTPFMPRVHAVIAAVAPNKPAAISGLQTGDIIHSINGELLNDDWARFVSLVQSNASHTINIELLRNEILISTTLTPETVKRGDQVIGYVGASPKVDDWPEEYKQHSQYGVVDAFSKSLEKTWGLITLSIDMIGKLITGDISVKNLSGPVSIAQGAGNSASSGIVYFLSFLALISINLGIINLLPLPVLDGGHLVYYSIEALTGKPVPEKIQALGFKFGTIALLMLMTVAIVNDIARF